MNQTLNKFIKEKIIDNALAKAGIPQRKKALHDARADWAERVRLAAIGGPETEAEVLKTEKKIAALIAKLPEELRTNYTFVRYDSDIYLNLAGSRVRAYFNGNYRGYEQGEPDPIRKIAPMNTPYWQMTHSLPSSTASMRFTGKLKVTRPTFARTSPPHWTKPAR